MKSKEITLCGLAAVRARFQRDAASIQRLYFDHATSRKIGVMCRALASARKIYRCVEPAELEKIAGSVHHGGIIAVVKAPELRSPAPADLASWATHRAPVLVLDRIGNAHNLGALARSAAYFGISHLVIGDGPATARPNDAAYRVAEGGLEHVQVWQVRDLPLWLGELKAAGYAVIGAATRGGKGRWSNGGRQPLALILGNEEEGISAEVAAACTHHFTIPGRGAVESLNVSVAGAVLMWELWGRNRS